MPTSWAGLEARSNEEREGVAAALDQVGAAIGRVAQIRQLQRWTNELMTRGETLGGWRTAPPLRLALDGPQGSTVSWEKVQEVVNETLSPPKEDTRRPAGTVGSVPIPVGKQADLRGAEHANA